MKTQIRNKLLSLLLGLLAVGPLSGRAATLFTGQTPVSTNQDYPNGVLGTRFSAGVDGKITGLRFYAQAGDTDERTMKLWDAAQQMELASITGAPSGKAGWLELNLPTPVAVIAGAEYVVTYDAGPNGKYVSTAHFFDAPLAHGLLTAPAGAGVFNDAGFPTQSWNNSGYFADVAYTPTVPIAVLSVQGNGTDIVAGNTAPSLANGTQFGSVELAGGVREQVFTITNLGNINLQLAGNPVVAITGPEAADFSVLTQPGATLAAGAGTNFTIRFDPSALGPRRATVAIANSASPGAPLEFTIEGTGASVELVGNTEGETRVVFGTSVRGSAFKPRTDLRIAQLNAKVSAAATYACAVYAANGDGGTPGTMLRASQQVTNTADGWLEFPLTASLDLLASQSYWFMIWSDSGAADVYMKAGDVAGTTVWRVLPTGIVFDQWLDPMFILPNDKSAGACSIYAVGTPLANLPVILVKGNDTVITDGSATPSALDGTQFSGVDIARGTRDHTFTISNPGGFGLDLTGVPLVGITGPEAADFSVVVQPSVAIVPIGGSTTFTVRFAPSATGPRNATVVVTNSASSDKTYTFAIQGQGIDRQHQTLFPDSLISTKFYGPDDAVGYELGTVFHTAVAGWITHVRFYAIGKETGDLSVNIWKNSPEENLYATTWTCDGTEGWVTLPIPDLAVEPNDYTVSVSTGDGGFYNFLGGYFNTAGGNGVDLSYPVGAGVLGTKGQGRPTGVFGAKANYLRDIVFKAKLDKAIMVVKGNDTAITAGSATPSALDGTQFGGVSLGGGAREHTFTIANPGLVSFVLTGTPAVAIIGAQAADFSVITQPSATTLPGGSNVTFTVRFAPRSAGPSLATVVIANTVTPGNPFQFAIGGQGVDSQRQNLVPDTLTSAAGGPDNAGGYELGTVFRTAVGGMVTQVRVYALAEESGDHGVSIWRNSPEQLLFSTNWNFGGTAGWINLEIPALQVDANTDYTVAVSTGDVDYYPFVGHYFDAAGGNGLDLSYPAGAGVLGGKGKGRPTGVFAARANYLRDVVFAAGLPKPLQITHIQRQTAGGVLLRWEGDGALFQVLKASAVDGTYSPLSGDLSTFEYLDLAAPADQLQKYYRILRK